MIDTRPYLSNRYLSCYFKRINNKIEKVTKVFTAQTRAETIIKIAEEIGSSEMLANPYSTDRIGIKYVALKTDGSEENKYFRERMDIYG